MVTCLIELDLAEEICEVLLSEQHPADVPGVDGPEDLLMTETHDPLSVIMIVILIITIIIIMTDLSRSPSLAHSSSRLSS